ncbi:hypothetical protein SKAU_G00184400 [Synaphobranchus kaupii]|uniref:Uncharacterized protein n=1 Tax=Synaphobranchus kaupii TaxID=118154 RepID=A0A9Q1IW92_SYNKA|nr:hypothetical protein SKAU_G00184400 [Synaphobranchus kaupii]
MPQVIHTCLPTPPPLGVLTPASRSSSAGGSGGDVSRSPAGEILHPPPPPHHHHDRLISALGVLKGTETAGVRQEAGILLTRFLFMPTFMVRSCGETCDGLFPPRAALIPRGGLLLKCHTDCSPCRGGSHFAVRGRVGRGPPLTPPRDLLKTVWRKAR